MNMLHASMMKFFETPKPDKHQLARKDAREAHFMEVHVKESRREQHDFEDVPVHQRVPEYDVS